MSFLTPAFLLLGLLAAPIILMYMLRLRRREVVVSSTLLWQKLLRDREANAPWQKLRRNLLLILQLLILAALVLALARPFFPVPSLISGNTVVLLDASASMLAADVAPNRFAAAKAEADRLIGDLPGDSRMTLIQVGQTPTILAAASGDKAALRRALEQAEAETAVADLARRPRPGLRRGARLPRRPDHHHLRWGAARRFAAAAHRANLSPHRRQRRKSGDCRPGDPRHRGRAAAIRQRRQSRPD
jgi:hypothetical protein